METILTFASTEDKNQHIISELRNRKTIGEFSKRVGLTKRQFQRIKKKIIKIMASWLERKKGSGRRYSLNKSQKLQFFTKFKT